VGLQNSKDIADHDYDVFYIWLNPKAAVTESGVTATLSNVTWSADSTMWSTNGTQVSSAGPDGQPRMQIEPISAHALANAAARTPSEQGLFGHLTADQVNQILALDDFYANPSFDPGSNPTLYRYVTTLELAGPERGSPVVTSAGTTIEYDGQNDPIDGQANHEEVTLKTGGGFGKWFTATIGIAATWDYNDTRTNIMGAQKVANINLQSSTPCLHAYVDIYLDLAFGSWVAVPWYDSYSCAFDDYSTACTVGGTTMHCCPDGTAMVGLRYDQNVLKCAYLTQPGGARSLDTGTVRNNMHVCPFGQVMVGLHGDLNQLACQTIPGNPITSERVTDYTTSDGYMHTCDSTVLTSAMSGVRLDQDLFTCASNPGLQ
jgi:hypothetical protein